MAIERSGGLGTGTAASYRAAKNAIANRKRQKQKDELAPTPPQYSSVASQNKVAELQNPAPVPKSLGQQILEFLNQPRAYPMGGPGSGPGGAALANQYNRQVAINYNNQMNQVDRWLNAANDVFGISARTAPRFDTEIPLLPDPRPMISRYHQRGSPERNPYYYVTYPTTAQDEPTAGGGGGGGGYYGGGGGGYYYGGGGGGGGNAYNPQQWYRDILTRWNIR